MASPAVAACPTGADLATGIRVVDADGSVETVVDAGGGIVSQTIDYGDGEVAKNQLIAGVYVKQLSYQVDGVLDLESLMQITYQVAPTAMAPPVPGLSEDMRTTVTDTISSYIETQEHRWGSVTPFKIGDCTYDSILGEIRYISEFGTITEEVRYLPDLGIGLLTSYAYDDEPPESYKLVSIEALK